MSRARMRRGGAPTVGLGAQLGEVQLRRRAEPLGDAGGGDDAGGAADGVPEGRAWTGISVSSASGVFGRVPGMAYRRCRRGKAGIPSAVQSAMACGDSPYVGKPSDRFHQRHRDGGGRRAAGGVTAVLALLECSSLWTEVEEMVVVQKRREEQMRSRVKLLRAK